MVLDRCHRFHIGARNLVAITGQGTLLEAGEEGLRGFTVADGPPEIDEGFWEEKAEEARSVARKLTIATARLEMLVIAAAYARLARYTRHKRAAAVPAQAATCASAG